MNPNAPPPSDPLQTDPDENHRKQIAGLKRYDPVAWRRYNFADERERAVVEELLRQPWPRVKG